LLYIIDYIFPYILKTSRAIFGIALVLFVFVFVYGSSSFGELQAKNQTIFFMPASENCLNIEGNTRFIIPYFSNEEALLVPIENGTNKIKGGFTSRRLSDIPCVISLQNIGEVIK
jgi:hypothetical protein